jgi:hypothetical protein
VTPPPRRLTPAALTAILAATLIPVAFPTPATADIRWTGSSSLSSKIVYVEEHVGSRFDSALRGSVSFVDRYTGSDMRMGKCRTGYRCIRVVESSATHGYAAWTSWTRARKISEIRLSPTLARKGWYTRRSIIDHELGHANGVGHNAKCTSRMWPHYRCRNGLLPPRTFTKVERAKLARW